VYGVLRLADAGRAVRGAARSFGIVLITAVAFHRTVDIVLVASFMFAIEAARASKELIGIVVPAHRGMPMVTRNLDISALHIPDRTIGPVERIDAYTMSYLAVAPLIGAIVSAATDSAVPIVVGALVGAVVGVGIVAVAGAHALAARRMPSRQRVTSVVKDQIAAYAPEVAIYFSGGGTSTYQINMWLEVAAQLDQRVLIILRERAILKDLAPTSLPVLCVPGAVDLMDLDMPTVRVALYAANTGKNIHLLRLPGMAHVFIGHGDSDKVASINPFCKVYDEVWVAGPAGRQRYLTARTGVRAEDIVENVPIQSVSTGLSFAIVPLKSLKALQSIKPDLQKIREYFGPSKALADFYYITRDTQDPNTSIRSRAIFLDGEDPATGSAAGCCASWMVAHGVAASDERVMIEQGLEIHRPSRIFVRATKQDNQVINVRVGGNCVEVLRGELTLAD